jgi:hypothetical protein
MWGYPMLTESGGFRNFLRACHPAIYLALALVHTHDPLTCLFYVVLAALVAAQEAGEVN